MYSGICSRGRYGGCRRTYGGGGHEWGSPTEGKYYDPKFLDRQVFTNSKDPDQTLDRQVFTNSTDPNQTVPTYVSQYLRLVQMNRLMTKPTKWLCAQWRLRSAWASAQSDQSSLCAQWIAKDPSFLYTDSKDWSDWANAIFLVLSWGSSIIL